MSKNYGIRLWTIIGESNVGKSPTIRSLISCPTDVSVRPPDTSRVLLGGGGYLDVFARVRAVQEARWSPKDAISEVHAQAAKLQAQHPPVSVCWFNVLFALRFDPIVDPKATYPAAEAYLSAFVNDGWSIERVVLMSADKSRQHLSRFGAPVCWIDDSKNRAEANGRVRNHFGWA